VLHISLQQTSETVENAEYRRKALDFNGKRISLTTNIILGWKWLLATNTLGYTTEVLLLDIKNQQNNRQWD